MHVVPKGEAQRVVCGGVMHAVELGSVPKHTW